MPSFLVVIGLGDVQVLQSLDRRAPGIRMLVVEPDAAVASRWLRHDTTAAWRAEGRLTPLIGPEYTGADRAWQAFPRHVDAIKVVAHPGLDTRHPEALRAARLVKDVVFGVRANAEARRKFAPRYLTNVLRNVPRIMRGRDVLSLSGQLRGVPAVIAAAGPSLDRVRGDLASVADRALLIAADTALRASTAQRDLAKANVLQAEAALRRARRSLRSAKKREFLLSPRGLPAR